jgi:hypothetical protein
MTVAMLLKHSHFVLSQPRLGISVCAGHTKESVSKFNHHGTHFPQFIYILYGFFPINPSLPALFWCRILERDNRSRTVI